jgi:succinate dehydrogenase / fumarate reductase cytochrome b subunit
LASKAAAIRTRPMSPHLQVWKWGPHMTVSILHRVTGTGMATVGVGLLVWFLAALASGPQAYATFVDVFTLSSGRLNILGWIVGVGLTLSFFQHMSSGVRHLIMDTGAAFELKTNKTLALLTFASSITLTVLFWLALELR